jgi:anti-sigma B factor antagonist
MARIQLAINAHEPYPGLKVVVLTGGLTIETVAHFNQSLRDEPAPILLLNLATLDWLDSAGVGALVQLMVRREKAQNSFAIAELSSRNQAVLQVSQLLRLFSVFPTTDLAIEYFARRGSFTSKTKIESA